MATQVPTGVARRHELIRKRDGSDNGDDRPSCDRTVALPDESLLHCTGRTGSRDGQQSPTLRERAGDRRHALGGYRRRRGDHVGCLEITADYEYRGLVAEAWDRLRGDTSAWPDRPFYRSIIEEQGGAALDVGCGTGRLTLDYLAAGLDVDGVDNSPEMLEICRAKAAERGLDLSGRLFEQELDALRLPRRYRTIFVPSATFQLLTDEGAAAAALQHCHAHLEPGGVLVMSFIATLWGNATRPAQLEWSTWRLVAERPWLEQDSQIRRFMRTRYDHAQQLQHEENRYELLVGGQVTHSELHRREPNVRWYTRAQIRHAVHSAGFADVRLTSEFTNQPALESDAIFCVLARREAS